MGKVVEDGDGASTSAGKPHRSDSRTLTSPPDAPLWIFSALDAPRAPVSERRWVAGFKPAAQAKPALLDEQTLRDMDLYGARIEHFIGTVKTPVGVAGPLRVHGRYAGALYDSAGDDRIGAGGVLPLAAPN